MASGDISEEVVFDNTVEAHFHCALDPRITVPMRAKMKEHGIDLGAKLKPSYSRPTYYRCLQLAAEKLYPALGPERAKFELGKAFMADFGETMMGKATLAMLRMMSPKRVLIKMSQSFRSSNNYMQASVKELGPGEMELTLSETSGVPSYFEGVLDSGLKLAGAQDLSFQRVNFDSHRCTMRIRWRA